MTLVHWYRGKVAKQARAFTTRPDLWPPGTRAWSVVRAGLPGAYLAAWTPSAGVQFVADTRYSAPGAAEALILADQVLHRAEATGASWEGP